MAQRSPRQTLLGMASGTTWGSPIAMGTLDGVMASIDEISLQGDSIADVGEGGSFGEIQFMDVIRHTTTPTFTIPMRRTGNQNMFWAHLVGNDTKAGTSPTTHSFNWTDESTLFATVAIEINDADIIEWGSLKTTAITIEPDGDGFMQWVVSTIGDTINIAGNATNAGSDFNNLTFITQTLRIPFRETRLRINEQEGGSLGSSNEINALSFSLAINRAYDNEELNRGASTGVEYQTLEPIRNDHTEIILGFDTPDYTTLELLDDFKDEDAKKGDLFWAKTISTAYTDLIEMGHLEPLPHNSPLLGGGRIPLTRNFQLLQPQSTPTGFDGATILFRKLQDAQNVTYQTNA